MTLLITAASRDVIYQSADFRLSGLHDGQIITDRSTKLVTLTYSNWQGFITYTGIGKWDGIDTSVLIVRWLAGNSEISPDKVEQLLQDKGGSWLTRIADRLGPQRHTFVFGCFDPAGARVSVISNFENGQGRADRVPSRRLTVTRLRPRLSLRSWSAALRRRSIGLRLGGCDACCGQAQQQIQRGYGHYWLS